MQYCNMTHRDGAARGKGAQLSSRKGEFRPCQSTGRRLASIFDEPWPVGRKSVVGVLACRTALQCWFGRLDRRFQVLHHSCLFECVALFCHSVILPSTNADDTSDTSDRELNARAEDSPTSRSGLNLQRPARRFLLYRETGSSGATALLH